MGSLCRGNLPLISLPHVGETLEDPFQGSCSTNTPGVEPLYSSNSTSPLTELHWPRRGGGKVRTSPNPTAFESCSQERNAPIQASLLLLPHCHGRLLTLTTVALSKTKKTPFAFACWMMQTHLLTFLGEHFSSVNRPAMISLPCQWRGSGESLFNV